MPACCIPDPSQPSGWFCGNFSSCAACLAFRANATCYEGLQCNQVICGRHACCSDEGVCSNEVLGNCNGTPMGVGTQCRANTCEEFITGGCCYLDGSCQDIRHAECIETGGRWHRDELCQVLDCPRPPPENEFRAINAPGHEPRIPEGGLRWTYDLCAPAFFEPMVREDDESYASPQSSHPVRAVEVDLGQVDAGPTPGESCAHHWGHLGVGLDGFVEPYFCSQPNYAREHNQTSLMTPVIQRVGDELDEANPDSIIDDGFAAFLGTYHAPYWTEAQFHSGTHRCLAIS
jgi:hypothetical protein